MAVVEIQVDLVDLVVVEQEILVLEITLHLTEQLIQVVEVEVDILVVELEVDMVGQV